MSTSAPDRGGRPALTTAHELAMIAQELFVERGFDTTSVDDIAATAGISRRTFFRYFATKADVLWIESPAELARFRALLAGAPAGEPWQESLCHAAAQALQHPPERRAWMFHRAKLLLTVPTVQEKAALRHAEWRTIGTEFATGKGAGDLIATAAGHAVLAATLGVHDYWISHPDEDLPSLHERLLQMLLSGL